MARRGTPSKDGPRDGPRDRPRDRPGAGEPTRRCIASGAVRGKESLIRFVVDPDGTVVPDVEERLPGRGLWLSAERNMVHTACVKNLFAKAARAPVRVPDDLAERTERLLVRRCLDLIGLARRAGQASAGFEKARARLAQGKAGLTLAAQDGAPAGRRKIRALAPDLPLAAPLRAAELGAAFGRPRVVHAILAPGRLADAVMREAARLAGLRDAGPASEERGARRYCPGTDVQ